MKKYPIGIQDFRKLREGSYLYVDKTEIIRDLIESGQYYFLSRPRRFGKSLLISTLKYLFQGKRDLFKGLWIEENYNWQPHPVLHFSFSSIGYKDLGLHDALLGMLYKAAKENQIELKEKGLSLRFKELLEKLAKEQGKVVLLIDEYDKPLVDYIDQPDQAEKNRDIFKNFFSILKDADPHLRLLLITGVSKFSKVSLFSDLNNLDDITLAPDFATLTGYTEKEVDLYFQDEIKDMSLAQEKPVQAIRDQVRLWYNGYSWGEGASVYNPFSILKLFRHQRFSNYWWETGTPTFLIKKLQKEFRYDLDHLEASNVMFESFTIDNLNWLALLFQTGYLTIHSYNAEERLYTLGYPNLEVRDTMHQHLLASFRQAPHTESLPLLVQIKRSLETGNIEGMIKQIDTLFATIPHQIFLQKHEAFFHAILHLSFSGLGLLVQSEVSTAQGRVDIIVQTSNHIYVMEFKLDASAEQALEQIRNKRYGNSFLGQAKEVIALGINFSSAKKAVAEWRAVPYETLLVEG